jgi:biopolymer transport protein ExbD
MSRFRQHIDREVPALNLAALPDLIFTVLFFFMIVTHMRQVETHVRYQLPQGTEVGQEANKTGLVYILIGESLTPNPGFTPNPSPRGEGNLKGEGSQMIQVNDRMVRVDEVAQCINRIREEMTEEERQRLTVCIRADRNTEMGIINDVKQQLRRAGALNIFYAAKKQNKQSNR